MGDKKTSTDIILIGAGIMSATLGTILKQLSPEMDMTIIEKLKKPGLESTNVWNNAGTGHAALCELNYTTENDDGSIDISKALKINEQFLQSKQFWAYLVKNKLIDEPESFIRALPHLSWVVGESNVKFLKKRYETLIKSPLFEEMEFTEKAEILSEWLPLMMEDRKVNDPVAATKMDLGTDVNFGNLTEKLMTHLEEESVKIQYEHEVTDLERLENGAWEVKIMNHRDQAIEFHTAKHVFIGAGGGALHLLQKTGIPQSKQIGGFPVSGLFLVCKNPEVVKDHTAKVYGKAAVGAPPMSVPHLDTRFIDGKEALFFGPFAGFSPKFLKTGSNLDLIKSVKPNNLFTMLASGAKNFSLTKYLVQQLLLSKNKRMEALKEFVPTAKDEDWEIVVAGQRVQVIKDTEEGKGILRFGTEVVTSDDGSISALLGASPGASITSSVMIDLIKRCFPNEFDQWQQKIKEMIPSYGELLGENRALLEEVRAMTSKELKLNI